MNNSDYIRLCMQRAILKEVAKEYAGHTIENIIAQLDARIKVAEVKEKKDEN